MDRDLELVRFGFNREGSVLSRWTETKFGLGRVQLPGSDLVVGGLSNAGKKEH